MLPCRARLTPSQRKPHAHGARLGIAKLAVDTSYQAPAVYTWARGAGFAQVAPVKGVEGFSRGPSIVDATEQGRPMFSSNFRFLLTEHLPEPMAYPSIGRGYNLSC
jgi:hypothetical protein